MPPHVRLTRSRATTNAISENEDVMEYARRSISALLVEVDKGVVATRKLLENRDSMKDLIEENHLLMAEVCKLENNVKVVREKLVKLDAGVQDDSWNNREVE